MKQVFVLLTISLLLAGTGCNKSNTNPSNINPNTIAQFQWTYANVTTNADTIQATNSMTTIISPGDTFTVPYEIYAQTGAWSTPGTVFTAKLTSLAVGTYSTGVQDNGPNFFSENQTDIAPFTLSITSNSNGRISGNFMGTYNGQPITGTFTNVPIVH